MKALYEERGEDHVVCKEDVDRIMERLHLKLKRRRNEGDP